MDLVIRWFLILIVSAALGAALVQYMTASPLSMSFWVLIGFLLLAALVLVGVRFFRGWQVAAAALLAVIGLAGGWMTANALFLRQEENRALPLVTPPAVDQRDHTAVVYLTHGEPEGYDPMPWVETMKEMDHLNVPFIPFPFRPFFFNSYRQEYLKLGGSPHNIVHRMMLESLERQYRAQGDQSTRFYLSFLDSNPRPDEMVIRAINEGANRVVLMPVFLTISSHTEAGQELVEALQVEQYGVPLCQAGPLWDSPALKQMFVERANRNLGGTDKSKVGILLVGHGQPEEWDQVWPTQTEQETSFRQDIIEMLVADGYQAQNISLAWMEFKEPQPDEVAAQLAKNGVEKIFVYAASISASSLHSLYDIPEEVKAAKLPANVEVVNLGAWDNDPLVIQAIKEKIDACR